MTSSITQSFANLTSTIVEVSRSLSTSLASLASTVSAGITNVISAIRSFADSVISNIQTVFSNIASLLQSSLTALSTAIHSSVKLIIDGIKSMGAKIYEGISYVSKIVAEIPPRIAESLKTLYEGIKTIFGKIIDAIHGVISAFQSFTNPLVEIRNWLETKLINIGVWIWDSLDKVFVGFRTAISNFIIFVNQTWRSISEAMSRFIEFLRTSLLPAEVGVFVEWVRNKITHVFSTIAKPETFSAIVTGVANSISSAITFLVTTISTFFFSVVNAIKSAFSLLFETITKPLLTRKFEIDFSRIIPLTATSSIAPILGLVAIPASETLRDILISMDIIWRCFTEVLFSKPILEILIFLISAYFFANILNIIDTLEVALTPILARLGGKINVKALKDSAKDLLKLIMKEWVKTFIFTFSFWLFEPTKYILNPLLRNVLPIEIPTFHEIVEITRRYLPANVYATSRIEPVSVGKTYDNVEKLLYDVLAKRGYPMWFDVVVTSGIDKFHVTVTDRFNTPRVFPSALLYALPTPTDYVRMMLRDIIQNLEDFQKLMLMHGFHPDASALYFLLHFRYPSLERLFEFACRVASNVVWVSKEERGLQEYFDYVTKEIRNFRKLGMGFEPLTPKDLANVIESKYPFRDLSKVTEIAVNRVAEAFSPLGVYFKWHDLFPLAWLSGFTSDQMIAMELSADIPMRIDARWMYKWGVIDEEDLVRIVIARGMHPKWVEKITLAEMMNALAEERTFVRTGLINAFKEGFIVEENLWKQMRKLDTVKLLNKDVPIQFLDGEVKLLVLRAKYDRAMDILLNMQKAIFLAYAENLVDYSSAIAYLEDLTAKVNENLKIMLSFDKSYYDLVIKSLDVRRDFETVVRIRRWMRYAIIEVMNRVRSGYLRIDELDKTLGILRKYARLTDEDVAYFKSLALLMYSQFERQITVQSILKKLSKGVVSKEEALEKLEKAGVRREVAEHMVELYAKTYTLSITQYLAYANFIDIPPEFIEKKLDVLGVPEDEKRLILAVFNVKPISSERDMLVKRYLSEFEEGYIDEATVRSNLVKLGVLPKAIDILIEIKKVEKSMNAKKLMVDSILNRLRRGVIKLDDAINELKKYIVDVSLIYALIDKNIRTYTFSVDKMISMREYVPIDLEWIIEKAKMFGYPEQELKIIPAYTTAREISDDIKRLANELGMAFADGLITEEEFKRSLDELATLGGQVKQRFGVDWIVLSPEERFVLLQIYKIRALRRKK